MPLEDVDAILKRALARHWAYDYTGKWRLLCLTPEEERALRAAYEVPRPPVGYGEVKGKKKNADER